MGQPSKIHPFMRQSAFERRSLTRSIIMSSGTMGKLKTNSYELTHFLVMQAVSQVLGESRWAVSAYCVFQKLVNLDVNQLVLIRNALSVFLFSATRSSHKNYSLRAARSL